MLHISDDMVAEAIGAEDTQQLLLDTFRAFGEGEAAMQERVRTEAGGVKLSTLGAVIPGQEVLGAKVYSTIQGQFSFVIVLFSATDGRPLATMDAAAVTQLRTAAGSVVAARHLARADSRRMVLFGAGVQGREHVLQMARAFPLEDVAIIRHDEPEELPAQLSAATGTAVHYADPADTVPTADIVVTCSRATMPLFPGQLLKDGAFVAAVGSSLPTTRELDDTALARASTIAVEWRPQSLSEAGDLVLADPGLDISCKVAELGEIVTGRHRGRTDGNEIIIYKAVGVGLEDIAIAGLAYRRIMSGRR